MPKPIANLPYDTLLRYMLAHWGDIASAMRPSNQTLQERLLLTKQSHDILRKQLARHGIDLQTDAKEMT